MRIYAQVENGKVTTVAESPNQMVEVQTKDLRLLGTWYVDGSFIGHKIVLESDKQTITADGSDTATITATVYNWDDTVATDFALPITFEVNGAQDDTPEVPTNGVVTFPVASLEPGQITVKVLVDDPYLMSKGEVTIDAQ